MTTWQALNVWVLPHAALLPIWVQLSWAIVVSALVVTFIPIKGARLQVAGAVGLVMLWLGSSYLALAFQTPSLVTVMWALVCWWQAFVNVANTDKRGSLSAVPTWVFAFGVALGWALVLDTLNLWPSWSNPQLYALGFGAQAFWFVLLLSAAALWLAKQGTAVWLSVAALFTVYALLRLPTGNVWDALLDPFVWVSLHWQLWRRFFK